MAQTNPTAITALPTAPSIADPTNFAVLADAFVAALATLRTETNAISTVNYDNAVDAYNNAVIALAQAGIATTQAGLATTNGETQVALAAAQVALAAAYAVTAVSAPGTSDTSTTSLVVGTGAKSLTIQTGKSLVVGMPLMISRTSDPANQYMLGIITAYDSGSGALDVSSTYSLGAGTYTDWTVSLVGLKGEKGNMSAPVYTATSITGVAGTGYLVDTSAGAVTVTLPASPTLGDSFTFIDAKNTWHINNLTLNRNGNSFSSLYGTSTAEDLVCEVPGTTFTIFFESPNWKLI